MNLKTIENFLNNAENLYIVILFTLLAITIYVSAIGISTLVMVTDITYNESEELNNVNIIMKRIETINNYILYVTGGFLVILLLFNIIPVLFNKENKNKGQTMLNNLRNMSSIFVLLAIVIVVVLIMNAICNNIKNIATNSSNGDGTANDKLSIQGMYMSIFGIIASVILIVAIYLFFSKKQKLIDFSKFNIIPGVPVISPVVPSAPAA
jgi:succinate dehydrogenase/fumarate reductase cytochrome b subunit